MPRAELSTDTGDKPVGKYRYLAPLIGRPTSQPLVESTVSRTLNSKSASPPLRDADNVRSLIQLRGLRPPVLPPRLRRSGRNFDPPERGACAPLPPALRALPRYLDGIEAVPAAPSPQKRVSRGWLVERLAWSQPCGRDRASAKNRAQRRRGPGAAIDQAQWPLERIRTGHCIV